MLNGIGVSGLIAIGKVVKYIEKPLTYCNRKIEDTVSEKQRFLDAVTEFSESANALAAEIDTTAADGQILRGYTVMIKDPYLNEHINLLIDEGNCAEKALETACDRFIKLFTD